MVVISTDIVPEVTLGWWPSSGISLDQASYVTPTGGSPVASTEILSPNTSRHVVNVFQSGRLGMQLVNHFHG